MRRIIQILLFLFAIWLYKHPDTQALIKGVQSAVVEQPIQKAKTDFRKEAEDAVRRREEARAKEIDAALDKIDQGANP